MSPRPRVSAVSYLNTCPLIWGLLHGEQRGDCAVTFQLPSECAASLRSGEADIGLVPVAELTRQSLEIVADVGISSFGPVRSIFLVHRKPLPEIRLLAADSGSRTSVVLAQLLLRERFDVRPKVVEAVPDLHKMMENFDAALVIGDPALRIESTATPFNVLDLGDEWTRMTGLPMVYAAWGAKDAQSFEGMREPLNASYRYGAERIAEIVNQEASGRGIGHDLAYRYLTEHIRYELDSEALKGLREFERLARTHQLI